MNRNGFTLIEIAVALVIVGLLMAVGIPMIGVLAKRAKYIESRETVRSAREALAGTVVKNGTFAADPLGTSSPKTTDAWNKNLLFHADDTMWGSGKDVCGVTTTKTRVKECSNEACSSFTTKTNIAFLVYSNGEDADGVCTGTGVCTGGAGTCVFPTCTGTCSDGVCAGGLGTCSTCTATPGAYCTFPVWQQGAGYNSPCIYTATNPAFQYDDLVQYVTLDELRATRGCQFRITNTSLPDAVVGNDYPVVTLQATGDGSTTYTWSVTTGSLPAGISLNATSGEISGTPTSDGVYNFTVTATNSNNSTTSQAFTLNSTDRCSRWGMQLYNTSVNLWYKRLGGTCTPLPDNAAMYVYPGDTITLFNNSNCTTGRCASSTMTYDSFFKVLDSNNDCYVGVTAVTATTCTFTP